MSLRNGKTTIKRWFFNQMTHTKGFLIILLIIPLSIGGCGTYSFSGAAISEEVKTVTIQNFPNNADLVVPTLSQTFTEKLKQKFLRDTRLELVSQGGDLVFSGSITRYDVSPEVVQDDRKENLSKLAITIQTKYTNKVNPDQNFEQAFTQDERFESNKSLSSIEDQLIQNITDRITENIFNKSVNNW